MFDIPIEILAPALFLTVALIVKISFNRNSNDYSFRNVFKKIGRMRIGGDLVNGNQTKAGRDIVNVKGDHNVYNEPASGHVKSGSAKSSKYQASPLPNEIVEEVNKLPLFQQKAVQSSYEGQSFEWILKVISLRPSNETGEKGDLYSLMLNDPKHYRGTVGCTLSLSKNPRLKTLKRDELVRVAGKITSVDSIWFEMDLDSIEYDIES